MNTTFELPATWLAAFPGTRYFPEHRLMTWHPRGIFNAVQAQAIVHWLEAVELQLGDFHRFADFSEITDIHLSASDIAELAAQRGTYSGGPIMSVFLASTPFSYGIAAMYKQLMIGTPIQVDVVVLLTSACAALDVPPDVLIRQA